MCQYLHQLGLLFIFLFTFFSCCFPFQLSPSFSVSGGTGQCNQHHLSACSRAGDGPHWGPVQLSHCVSWLSVPTTKYQRQSMCVEQRFILAPNFGIFCPRANGPIAFGPVERKYITEEALGKAKPLTPRPGSKRGEGARDQCPTISLEDTFQ